MILMTPMIPVTPLTLMTSMTLMTGWFLFFLFVFWFDCFYLQIINLFLLSILDPASGIISLSGSALDHESIEHYILTVSASDSGNPVLTATATVYVNVKDINDNPPSFPHSEYNVVLPENNLPGVKVTQIKASTCRDYRLIPTSKCQKRAT